MSTRSETIIFEGHDGQRLSAKLDLPPGRPSAYALFAHCFTCSKQTAAAVRIGRGLAAQGIGVLRFDFTGLGSSEGDFANTNFSSNVEDLVAAAAYLRAEHRPPRILIGHSLGGAAVLMAAQHIPEVKAVATVNAPCDPGHVEHLLADATDQIEREGEATVSIGGRPFNVRRHFLDDIRNQAVKEAIQKLRRALVIFHAPFDNTVSVDNARRIFQVAKHPKSFVSLDGADHLLSNKADSAYVATVIAAWAVRYVDELREIEAPKPGDPSVVLVEEAGTGKFVQTARRGKHFLVADEPVKIGGDDLGPSPYDLLMMGLGACTNMTLRMYADRKGWPLEGVSTELRHQKVHAKDCEQCQTETGRIDRIEKVVSIEGPLDDEQRARLLEISHRCPVNRTLLSEVDIQTTARPDET